MNYLYYSTGIICGGVIGYYGYKYAEKKFYEYLFNKVKQELDKRLESEEGFVPMRKTTSAILKVSHGGKTHSIYVPYNRRKSSKMVKHNVYLYKGDEKIDITQKPGVPYLVSAFNLGGDMIVVENKEGEVLHTYKEEEIPDCF